MLVVVGIFDYTVCVTDACAGGRDIPSACVDEDVGCADGEKMLAVLMMMKMLAVGPLTELSAT